MSERAAEAAPSNGAAPHPAAQALSRAAEHLLAAAAALSGNGGPWGGRYDQLGKPDPVDVATEQIIGPALDEFMEDKIKPALDAFEARIEGRIAYLESLAGAKPKPEQG